MSKSKTRKGFLKIKEVKNLDDLQRRAMTIGFYGVAGFLGYKFLLKPSLVKFKKKNEQKNILTDINKQQASFFYNAMNPSGISWMRAVDYTDEKVIFDSARKVTNWNAVQASYSNLYNRNLLSDLQSDLSTVEYKTFLRIISSGKASQDKTTSVAYNRGMIICSSKDVRLRSTPDSSISRFSFSSNILGTAKANSFLGWATGRTQVDDAGVKYLQVMIKFLNAIPKGIFKDISEDQKSKTLSFWVGAGAVNQYSDYNQLTEAGVKMYPGLSDMGLRPKSK